MSQLPAERSIRSFFQQSSSASTTEIPTSSSSAVEASPEHCHSSSDEESSVLRPPSPDEPRPSKKTRPAEKRLFKDDWKVRYLICPGKTIREDSEGKGVESEYMVYIQCQERLKAKSSTAVCHIERRHPGSKLFSLAKKQRLIKHFETMYSKQVSVLRSACEPEELVKLAPYKLAFVIAKLKMPFSSCHAFVEFARAADPNSSVFSRMARGRDTITRRTQEMHKSLLKPSLVNCVRKSPFWSLVADESADSATMEQLGIYV